MGNEWMGGWVDERRGSEWRERERQGVDGNKE